MLSWRAAASKARSWLSDGKRLVIRDTLENLCYKSIFDRLSEVAGKTYALGTHQFDTTGTQHDPNNTQIATRDGRYFLDRWRN
jgi:hypothetical protein